MKNITFEEAMAQILARDARFHPDAYRFLQEALEFTIRYFEKPAKGPGRHVSGQELCEGFRQCALKEFGPMACRVLAHWGVQKTEDVGAMVFNLVETGVLGKTERDRVEDFANGYAFDEAFIKPFLPTRRHRRRKSRGAERRTTSCPSQRKPVTDH